MSDKYIIDAVFRIIDGATAPLKKVANVGDVVGARIHKSIAAADRRLAAVGNTIKTVGKVAAGIGIGAVVAGIGIATKQYIEFENSLYGAAAAFSDLDATAPDFTAQVKSIGKAAREVAAKTEFNATQTANALAVLARAGADSASSVALLPGVADLATAAVVSMDDAVGMAVGSLNVFGLMSKDPLELADNMARVSDIMASTADAANMSLIDVAEAAKYGGANFAAANQSIENFAASTIVLAEKSITGAEAGRAMKNIMTKIAAPATQGAKALDNLGIITSDSEGNLLNFVDIIGQLETSLAGMGTAQRADYLKDIFGLENIVAANALIDTGAAKLIEYTDAIANSQGAAAEKAAVMRLSLKNQIEVLKSGLTELGFKFVEAFEKKGSAGLQTLIGEVETFDPQPLINAVILVADKFIVIAKKVWDFRGAIIAVTATIIGFKVAMMAIVAGMKAYQVIQSIVLGAQIAHKFAIGATTSGMIALNYATKATATATAIFSGALKLVNFLFSTTPIGWIILALGVLIPLIITCVKNWDKISEALAKAWTWTKNMAAIIWDGLVAGFTAAVEWIDAAYEKILVFFGPIGALVAVVKSLVENFGMIKTAFAEGGIVAGIKAIGAAIFSGILAPLQGLFELLSHIPGIGKLAGAKAAEIAALRESLTGGSPETPAPAAAAAPVTQGERAAYSREESFNKSEMYIGVDERLRYNVSGKAPGITVKTTRSAEYSY